jgi:hypothetical protein
MSSSIKKRKTDLLKQMMDMKQGLTDRASEFSPSNPSPAELDGMIQRYQAKVLEQTRASSDLRRINQELSLIYKEATQLMRRFRDGVYMTYSKSDRRVEAFGLPILKKAGIVNTAAGNGTNTDEESDPES